MLHINGWPAIQPGCRAHACAMEHVCAVPAKQTIEAQREYKGLHTGHQGLLQWRPQQVSTEVLLVLWHAPHYTGLWAWLHQLGATKALPLPTG
jgi:hypothetical protein